MLLPPAPDQSAGVRRTTVLPLRRLTPLAGLASRGRRPRTLCPHPRTAPPTALPVVSGSCPKGEIGAGQGVAEHFAGLAARMSSSEVAVNGIIRVGTVDEGGHVIVKGGLSTGHALFGRRCRSESS